MPMQIELEKKLEHIEKEIDSLKANIIKISQIKENNKIIKLEGALKGISVTEEDIENAKKSLFKGG